LTAAAIREAAPADLAHVRALFEEYAAWLAVDLSFQGFAEELATLPGKYAPPRGRLYVAHSEQGPVGCIALRPLPEAGVGEVKRLYVRPVARGARLGEALTRTLLGDARNLYERLGFVQRSPYYHNPVPGTVYMSLAL